MLLVMVMVQYLYIIRKNYYLICRCIADEIQYPSSPVKEKDESRISIIYYKLVDIDTYKQWMY